MKKQKREPIVQKPKVAPPSDRERMKPKKPSGFKSKKKYEIPFRAIKALTNIYLGIREDKFNNPNILLNQMKKFCVYLIFFFDYVRMRLFEH